MLFPPRSHFVAPIVAAIVLGAGCSSPANAPPAEESAIISTAPPVETEEPRPEFVPGGAAETNLPIFELTLQESGAGTARGELSLIVDALVAVGFPRESLSHTAPASKIELPADSTSIAVEIAGDCLIGQFSDEWLAVAIAEPTPSGCLIGDVIELTSLEESP